MNYIQAMDGLAVGYKMQREAWAPDAFVTLEERTVNNPDVPDIVALNNPNGTKITWTPEQGDKDAEDWRVKVDPIDVPEVVLAPK